jgi:hypothetical protein
MQLTPVYAEITAYDRNCAICETTNRTASGGYAHDYGLASDPSLPFGSTVYIPFGHGILDNARSFNRSFSVDDRGGRVTREAKEHGILRLDIRVQTHEYATKIGRKRMIVYVVTK